MNELLKRIAIHGGLAAVLLAVVGYIYAEMAGAILITTAGPGNRRPDGTVADTMKNLDPDDSLHRRVPLMMAFWGFTVVSCVELVKHLLKRGKKPITPAPPPDDAERLLNELLQQVEAAEKANRGEFNTTAECQRDGPPTP